MRALTADLQSSPRSYIKFGLFEILSIVLKLFEAELSVGELAFGHVPNRLAV
jgi:hypothetical protein